MNPSITIITAVYNGASTICDCLQSVSSQTVPVEHIIIDGASTDNTLEIVREISPHARIISEPDSGIYDAMNKGIRLATGDIIGILNSDDFYTGPKVLETVINIFADSEIDACYSDLVYVDQEKTDRIIRYWKSSPYHDGFFEKGWMPPHPTFFVRRQIYERYGALDTNFPLAADYELMLRLLYRYKINSSYIPSVLVKMRAGGTSNPWMYTAKAIIENYRAWKVNGLSPGLLTFFRKILSKIWQFFCRQSTNTIVGTQL